MSIRKGEEPQKGVRVLVRKNTSSLGRAHAKGFGEDYLKELVQLEPELKP